MAPSIGPHLVKHRTLMLFFNCIEHAVTFNDDLVVLGDLNWDYNRYPDKKFISYIENSCGLTQIVQGPTRVTPSSQSSIDLIFTSYPIFHINTSIIKYTLSDHFLITTQVTAKISNIYCTNSIRKRSLRKFNKSLFIKDLYHSKVFRDILSLQSVNTAWNNWIYEYRRICDIHAPIHFIRSKQKHNFFISRELLDKMYQRDHIHFKAIKTKSEADWLEYKKIRNEVTALSSESRKQNLNDQITNNRSSSKNMWKTLKTILPGSKIKTVQTYPIPASDFNNFFGSIGNELTKNVTQPESVQANNIPSHSCEFNMPYISVKDTIKSLKSLPNTRTLDPLDIDGYLLRLAHTTLAPVLTHIYNLSLKTGEVPSDWKLARITPIYKGEGSKKDPNNYRPISVTCHLVKPLERHVKDALINFLVNNKLFSDRQSAVIKSHSTATVLHGMVNDWLGAIDGGNIVTACMLDMKKGFDILSHEILLNKIQAYGIKGNSFSWFQSYLSQRSHFVKTNNILSSTTPVEIGVPQGTVLGPALFLLFVNDLLLTLENNVCKIYMYADDITIYCSSSNLTAAEENLQNTINLIQSWFQSNKLLLNPKKSTVMLIGSRQRVYDQILNITINGVKLEQKDSTKLLGVLIDKHLTWTNNSESLARDLSRRLPLLNRLSYILPRKSLKIVYNCLFQSKIDYCLTVWGHCSKKNLNLIQKIQNRAARIITLNTRNNDVRTSNLLKELGWMSILNRLKYFMSLLVYKCIHGLAPCYLSGRLTFSNSIHSYNTRFANDHNLIYPKTSTSYYKSSFDYQAPSIWNNIDSTLKTIDSIQCFKTKLKAFF